MLTGGRCTIYILVALTRNSIPGILTYLSYLTYNFYKLWLYNLVRGISYKYGIVSCVFSKGKKMMWDNSIWTQSKIKIIIATQAQDRFARINDIYERVNYQERSIRLTLFDPTPVVTSLLHILSMNWAHPCFHILTILWLE